MDEAVVERKSRVSVVPGVKSGSRRTQSILYASQSFDQGSRTKIRRYSYGFAKVAGVKNMEISLSQGGMEYKRPPLLYLPTYQLEPRVKFHVPNVTKLVETLIEENFANHKYHALESPALALRLSNEIMRQVKFMGFNRYRIISVVTIGQNRAQSFNNVVAFIWDHERDNYVESHRETPSAFMQAIVFGVYLD